MGLPPDADALYHLKNIRWWAEAHCRHSDETGTVLFGKSTTAGVMMGGDMRLGSNSGIGFGVGYSDGTSK